MANTERLYELISSLSRGEKLNFKKFASKHILGDGNSYVKLFDFINKQSKNGVYDESAVKEHFKDEKFVKNFSVMKSYLYENILKSLSASQNNDEPQTLLRFANILFSKGLNTQVADALKKAKKAAIKNEDFNTLLGVLDLEYNFGMKFYIDNRLEKLESILNEKKEAVKKTVNLNEYNRYLLKTSYYRSKEAVIRNEKEKTRMKRFIQNTPMIYRDRSLSNRAKFLYLIIKSMSHYSLGNYSEAYKYFKLQLLLIESTPFLRKNVANHILILYDVSYMALVLSKFDEVPALLLKLDELVRQKVHELPKLERLNSLFFYYLIKLDAVLKTADFDNCSSVLSEVENFINTYPMKGYTEFPYLVYSLSTVYFAKGDYANALQLTNKFFNEKDFKIFSDLALAARILNIFIHYELKNVELLQYMVRSLYHFLLKSNRNFKFEIYLIRFIRRLSNVRSNEDFIVNLRIFKRELLPLLNDPFESRVFLEYFDYITWIDSKIENIPLYRALKSRMTGQATDPDA